MTLPFDNDASKIVKKLSTRSLAADRRRNLFVILTIALAVCLMSVCAFLSSAGNAQTIEQIRGQYQSGCNNLTHADIARLVGAGKFEKWG